MNKIKEIRKKRGLNQKEFASLLGIKQTTLSGYERGAITMNNKIIMKICFLLNVTPNELLGWEEAYREYVFELISMKKEG